jgi:Domain of unknown function (DUF4156)
MATHMSPLEAVVALITVVLGVLGLWRVLLSTRVRRDARRLSLFVLVMAVGAVIALYFLPWKPLAQALRAFVMGVLVVCVLSGCVMMSPQAESIRVIYNPLELTAACTSLGEVKSWSGWGGFAAGAGYENAERGLREDTASLGGNTLLALYSRGGDLAGVSSRGQAYRCP